MITIAYTQPLIIQYDVVVVLISYPIKSNISTRDGVKKFSQRGYVVILTDVPNAIDKIHFISPKDQVYITTKSIVKIGVFI